VSYFGGSSGMRGDPGFFDTLKSIGSAFIGATPIGAAIQAGIGQFRGPARAASAAPPPFIALAPTFEQPGGGGGITRISSAGARNGAKTVVVDVETGLVRAKRRRMNVGNPKALRRAIRRTDGFVTLARGALKNTGFKIVSKSSGKVSRATMDKAVAAAHHRK